MTSTPMSGNVTAPVRWDMGVPIRGVYLYRIFDADNRLLYVGVTEQLRTRLRAHARQRPAAASCAYTEFSDRRLAEAAEAVAIRDEKPAHNVSPSTGRFQ